LKITDFVQGAATWKYYDVLHVYERRILTIYLGNIKLFDLLILLFAPVTAM